jgi:hypothetical protein
MVLLKRKLITGVYVRLMFAIVKTEVLILVEKIDIYFYLLNNKRRECVFLIWKFLNLSGWLPCRHIFFTKNCHFDRAVGLERGGRKRNLEHIASRQFHRNAGRIRFLLAPTAQLTAGLFEMTIFHLMIMIGIIQ